MLMTQKAAEIFNRGRRSGTSSQEAWDRLKELGEETEWDTDWMRFDSDTAAELDIRPDLERRYEHE